MLAFAGLRVVESEFAVDRRQVRFPRSRRRRIRQKWAKDESNFTSKPAMYRFADGTVLVHPILARQLRNQLEREQETWERKWR